MNQQPGGGRQSVRERLKSVPKQVVIGLIVTAIIGALIAAYKYLEDRVTTEPLTANMSAPDGQMSVRPFFELQIQPVLGAYCSEPAWVQWLGEKIWDEHCWRIAFEPHTLASMIFVA